MVLTTVRTILGYLLAVPPMVWALVELWEWWTGRRKGQKGTPPEKPSWEKTSSGLSRPEKDPRPEEDPVEPSDPLADSEEAVPGDPSVAADPRASDVHEYAF
jgi:hypothetical protein